MVRKYTRKKTTKPKRRSRKTTTGTRKRSTATRRRNARRGPKAAATMDPDARKSLAIYTNPFSTTNGPAKIPDGKAISSVGVRLRVSAQLHNNKDTDGNPFHKLHVLLYPGLTQGMVVWGDTQDFGTRSFTAYQFSDHNTFNLDNIWNNGTITPGDAISNDGLNQWRMVSQALKLSLLNTDEENDGYWEAIRYTDSFVANEFGFYSGNNQDQMEKCVFGPDSSMYVRLASRICWTMTQS